MGPQCLHPPPPHRVRPAACGLQVLQQRYLARPCDNTEDSCLCLSWPWTRSLLQDLGRRLVGKWAWHIVGHVGSGGQGTRGRELRARWPVTQAGGK